MVSNLDRYKKDLAALMLKGHQLHLAMQAECLPDEFEVVMKQEFGNKSKKVIARLPSFKEAYQPWYSEARSLIKQLLPDRLADFVRHYEKPKPRKDISFENYRIEDYLQGLNVTRGFEKAKVVGPDAAIPHFRQQLSILQAVKSRFESSLYDIHQLVQADLFDSELEAALELARSRFTRAAGVVAGVVLEKHLRQFCDNRGLKISKKAPGISDLNNVLKEAGVVDVPQWRFIQHLGDIRNICGHDKKSHPKTEQVDDLIVGVSKTIKTLF